LATQVASVDKHKIFCLGSMKEGCLSHDLALNGRITLKTFWKIGWNRTNWIHVAQFTKNWRYVVS